MPAAVHDPRNSPANVRRDRLDNEAAAELHHEFADKSDKHRESSWRCQIILRRRDSGAVCQTVSRLCFELDLLHGVYAMPKRTTPITAIWEHVEPPDETDLALIFDMLLGETPHNLTGPDSQVSLAHDH